MSVIVTLSPAGEHVVPIDTAQRPTVASLLTAVRSALGLPHPAWAYDVRLGDDCGGDDLTARMDARLEDVGVHGCEERVWMRLKYSHVARLQLEGEGVTTQGAAGEALCEAAKAGAMERVKMIAASGITECILPLAQLMSEGHTGAVRAVLGGAGGQLAPIHLNPLLSHACDCDMREAAVHLMRLGADIDAPVGAGVTPLYHACDNGHRTTVKLLLALGADAGAISPGEAGGTPLHVCDGRHVDIAALLITHGADVNARDENQRTPLHEACDHGDSVFAGYLADRGADVHARDAFDDAPIHVAVEGGAAVGVVGALLRAGADIDAKDSTGRTVLMRAAEVADDTLALLLVSAGADLNVRDPSGATALLEACRAADGAGVATLLVRAGADVNATDDTGDTPLLLAAGSSSTKLAMLLLENGADVHARCVEGFTALAQACARAGKGAADLVSALVQRGVDVNAEAPGGTPLELARRASAWDVVDILLDNGAAAGEEDAGVENLPG